MLLMMGESRPGERDVRLGLESDEFQAFYRVALPRVYGYLLRGCGSVSVAEDLTQETFLAAVVELKRQRRVDAPLPWIFGIARHKLVDHYRRTSPPGSVDAGGAEQAGLFDDSDGRVVSALAAVSGDQRLALFLRHVNGLSVPEVATVLDRSVEAVESLLARGRVSFRKAYAEGES